MVTTKVTNGLKTHHRFLGKNITPDEITDGIARWTAAALSFEDGKTGLTKANLVKMAHAHYIAHPELQARDVRRNCHRHEILKAVLETGGRGKWTRWPSRHRPLMDDGADERRDAEGVHRSCRTRDAITPHFTTGQLVVADRAPQG